MSEIPHERLFFGRLKFPLFALVLFCGAFLSGCSAPVDTNVIGSGSPLLPVVEYSQLHMASAIGGGPIAITYPNVLSLIQTSENSTSSSTAFGPEMVGNFQLSMRYSVSTNPFVAEERALLVRQGWISEGLRKTPNGYDAEVLSLDSNAHPQNGFSACDFSYLYIVPLRAKSASLTVRITVSEPSASGEATCTLFQEPHYPYFKDIVEGVYSRVEPGY